MSNHTKKGPRTKCMEKNHLVKATILMGKTPQNQLPRR